MAVYRLGDVRFTQALPLSRAATLATKLPVGVPVAVPSYVPASELARRGTSSASAGSRVGDAPAPVAAAPRLPLTVVSIAAKPLPTYDPPRAIPSANVPFNVPTGAQTDPSAQPGSPAGPETWIVDRYDPPPPPVAPPVDVPVRVATPGAGPEDASSFAVSVPTWLLGVGAVAFVGLGAFAIHRALPRRR